MVNDFFFQMATLLMQIIPCTPMEPVAREELSAESPFTKRKKRKKC